MFREFLVCFGRVFALEKTIRFHQYSLVGLSERGLEDRSNNWEL